MSELMGANDGRRRRHRPAAIPGGGNPYELADPRAQEQFGRAIAAWLPNQRWFGGKGRRIASVTLVDWAAYESTVGERIDVLLPIVEVAYDDGPAERYFVPLVGNEDGLANPAACRSLFSLVEIRPDVPTQRGGAIRFEAGSGLETIDFDGAMTRVRPLGVEQSNTSIVFGDTIIMKCFRRVLDGPNPDLEVPRFLATRTRFNSLPRLVGTMEYESPEGVRSSLAILQEFVKSQGDGWSYTLRALAAGELREDSAYMEEVRALGRVTAELHLALASDPEAPDFAPEAVDSHDLRVWRDGVLDQVGRSYQALRRALSELDLETKLVAERALAAEEQLMERADAVLGLQPASLSKTRFHGDYHLGQVLKTEPGWLVLDFEGEPLRSLAERRAKHCPLRDVAGMLRSFSYARQAALRDPGGAGPGPSAEGLAAWERAARVAYLGAYFERAGEAVFLPREQSATRRLLDAFEVEKAAYELEYELNNRPDWVGLPLSYLADGPT